MSILFLKLIDLFNSSASVCYRNSRLVTLITLLLVATPLTAILVLFSHTAEAISSMSKQIKGDGSNGDVICPPSIPEVQISGETVKIGFTAAKDSGGKILGSWQISTGTLGNKKGTIVGGEVGAGQYKLKGTEDIDEMCKVHDTPTTVTISGQCGQGVTIQVQAASGEKASFFAGLVTCG